MTARVLRAPDVVVTDDLTIEPSAIRAAIEDAFRQGQERGRQKANGGLDDEIQALRVAISGTTQALRGEVATASRLDAETLVELASDLVGWLVDGAIESDPAVLMDSVQRALAALADESGLVLHLHPDVVEVVGDGTRLGVDAVRADPTLARSDFRLVADGSMIERRWSDLAAAMKPDLVDSVSSPRTSD